MPIRRAFVSHSSADDRLIAEMESFLRASGFEDVFNDVHAIKPDEQFWPRIEQGITDCDNFYVVITAASNNSEWVKREVALARRLGKRVIPVWWDDCLLPPDFADRDVIDFRPRARKERRFDIDRILTYAPAELIGREDETRLLNETWQKTLRMELSRPHVLTLVALGGEGKTALVAKWAAELAAQDWPGCDAALAWSFHSQGTREQQAASSDLFLKEALNFFAEGDPEEEEIKAFAASAAGTFEKGQRLARLVGQRRSLLILDGLELLQYAPTAPTPGELKDQGVAALLKSLATTSHGLCIVTTRYSLPDLNAFMGKTVQEEKLTRLSRRAGVDLLRRHRVKGSELRNISSNDGKEKLNEFEKLVEDVKGHALTLTLLGSYLRDAHRGDIRKRDLVKLEDADAEEQGGHAFRAMEAYEQAFEHEGDKGRRALAILRLLGLFDRPMTTDCFDALLKAPAIPGLTEPLMNLTDAQLNIALTRLESSRLLTVNRDMAGTLVSLDAHPLLREYFSKQLREQNPDAWRVAHRQLYEHLCKHKEGDQPTLEDLQPLYQAVAHGCQAGLQHYARGKVFQKRIRRGNKAYSLRRLGAFGSDLGAIACFFEKPWIRVTGAVDKAEQAWLLHEAAYCLRALGRLAEAIEPMRAGMEMAASDEHWEDTAIAGRNLSELQLTLGEVATAVRDAEEALAYADVSWQAIQQIAMRTAYADALHQAGRQVEAKASFDKAEAIQAARQPDYPLLASSLCFQYCDLLLAGAERAAWSIFLGSDRVSGSTSQRSASDSALVDFVDACRTAQQRTTTTRGWEGKAYSDGLLEAALDHLTLGRAALYDTILSDFDIRYSSLEVDHAVSGLRDAGDATCLLLALLTRAWFRAITGDLPGAQADLDEAWEIAERGPMRLFMADIHLYRARLFFREQKYPWESPEVDLRAAEKLINDCSYHRRDGELADAKHAILGR